MIGAPRPPDQRASRQTKCYSRATVHGDTQAVTQDSFANMRCAAVFISISLALQNPGTLCDIGYTSETRFIDHPHEGGTPGEDVRRLPYLYTPAGLLILI